MRAYIAYAQKFNPIIPSELHQYLVSKYVEKRKIQRDGNDQAQSYTYVTTRTLLGIIRLAQGMAKLSFREECNFKDVDEAIRLMDFSIRSLRRTEGSNKQRRKEQARQNEESENTRII